VLSGSVHRYQNAAFKTLGLPRRRYFEQPSMIGKPDVNNAVATHACIYTARNGFHFRQFRHFSIVGDE
jgi:hypothetical protein